MDKQELIECMGNVYEGILGRRYDPKGFVPKGRFLFIGVYRLPNGEWRGMGVARIKDGQENLAWLRGIRATNSGWYAEEAIPITVKGRTVENLSRMYYEEGVELATGEYCKVLHPNCIWPQVQYLPRYAREQLTKPKKGWRRIFA